MKRLSLKAFQAQSRPLQQPEKLEQLMDQVLGNCHDPERDGYGLGSSTSGGKKSGGGISNGKGGGSDRSN